MSFTYANRSLWNGSCLPASTPPRLALLYYNREFELRVHETKNIRKDKILISREGQPQELKGIYLYLASEAWRYTTDADSIIDGGYSLP